MNARIISIGSELILGQLVDTNAAWMAGRLAEVGVAVKSITTVGDGLDDITPAISDAARNADVVLISGGLGPTEDDMTRQALANAMGQPLELHEPSVERIRAFFRQRGRPMVQRNTIQAMFPRGATPIENTCGTAPGIRATLHNADVYVMPGVPREMKVMFDRDVRPNLSGAASGSAILSRHLHCFGDGESTIGETIGDLMQPGRSPAVGTRVAEGVITIRVWATGQPEQIQPEIDATVDELHRRLGHLVYGEGDDTLASVVGAMLAQRNLTLATAESCTGGLIAKRITDVPGASRYFLGSAVTYANTAKADMLGVDPGLIEAHGAVSEPVARAMAIGCRERFGSDVAVACSGIMGPDGGTADKPVGLVYIALADADGCQVSEHRMGAHAGRAMLRDRTASTALNMLRLCLLGDH